MEVPRPDLYVPESRVEHMQGFLRGCEAFSRHLGIGDGGGITFWFEEMPYAGTWEAAITLTLERWLGADLHLAITVAPEPGSVLWLTERYLHWLFDLPREYTRDPSLPLPEGYTAARGSVGQAFVDIFVAIAHRQPIMAYSLRIVGLPNASYYEEYYAVEAAGARYFLLMAIDPD